MPNSRPTIPAPNRPPPTRPPPAVAPHRIHHPIQNQTKPSPHHRQNRRLRNPLPSHPTRAAKETNPVQIDPRNPTTRIAEMVENHPHRIQNRPATPRLILRRLLRNRTRQMTRMTSHLMHPLPQLESQPTRIPRLPRKCRLNPLLLVWTTTNSGV